MLCLLGLCCLLIFINSCQYDPFSVDPFGIFDDDSDSSETVEEITGEPSAGAQEIYESSDLNSLCIDSSICRPNYDLLPATLIRTEGQSPLVTEVCNFDYDPNLNSSFVVRRVDGTVNGLDPLLSKQDLFFLAWVSIRYHINPHFLIAVMAQESFANCAAVSFAGGEGCFQITNTFGQAQLNQSYPLRVAEWNWTDRLGEYYPDQIFQDEQSYFGEIPATTQYRRTLDPSAPTIDGIPVSSVVNFHYGIIASALYFHWQPYLLYYRFDELRGQAAELFQLTNGKARWQAAAYNGGAFGAASALTQAGLNFLDVMSAETQDYADRVVDYCAAFQSGELFYQASFSEEDVDSILELLAMTYPDGFIDWDQVYDDVMQVLFTSDTDSTIKLSYIDDIKALVYVISTHFPQLAPEWPDEGSI